MNGGTGAVMPNGYILLHRKLIDASFYRRPLVVRLFTHILMAANHRPGTVLIRNQPFELQPGQALVSLRGLAEDTGISAQSARTALALLIRCGTLKSTRPVTHGPTVLTVCNWAAYQFVPGNANTPPNTPPTHRQHTANTIRKGREGDKGKKTEEARAFPAALDTEGFHAKWAEWMEHLRQKKKTPTALALKRQIAKCEAMGLKRALAMIDHSIEHNWQSLFEADGVTDAADDAPPGMHEMTEAELLARFPRETLE